MAPPRSSVARRTGAPALPGSFTRAGSGWTEQTKLSRQRFGECRNFGHSVALSSDGNTALVGEPGSRGGGGQCVGVHRLGSTWMSAGLVRMDLRGKRRSVGSCGGAVLRRQHRAHRRPDGQRNGGAAWVFTRSNGTWNLQTDDAHSTGALQSASASSVPPSPCRRTETRRSSAGPTDANAVGGAAWVFTRTNGAWSPQGGKLVPTNASGSGTEFGEQRGPLRRRQHCADRSADRGRQRWRRAICTRASGGVWTVQQRLTGTGETGAGVFGSALRWQSDGQTAMVGADLDDNHTGAVRFVFAPPNPVCNSVSATGPQGGGSVAVALSCTLPSGAHSAFSVLGGPSNGTPQQLQHRHRAPDLHLGGVLLGPGLVHLPRERPVGHLEHRHGDADDPVPARPDVLQRDGQGQEGRDQGDGHAEVQGPGGPPVHLRDREQAEQRQARQDQPVKRQGHLHDARGLQRQGSVRLQRDELRRVLEGGDGDDRVPPVATDHRRR